jgi:hypothetical protein
LQKQEVKCKQAAAATHHRQLRGGGIGGGRGREAFGAIHAPILGGGLTNWLKTKIRHPESNELHGTRVSTTRRQGFGAGSRWGGGCSLAKITGNAHACSVLEAMSTRVVKRLK